MIDVILWLIAILLIAVDVGVLLFVTWLAYELIPDIIKKWRRW